MDYFNLSPWFLSVFPKNAIFALQRPLGNDNASWSLEMVTCLAFYLIIQFFCLGKQTCMTFWNLVHFKNSILPQNMFSTAWPSHWPPPLIHKHLANVFLPSVQEDVRASFRLRFTDYQRPRWADFPPTHTHTLSFILCHKGVAPGLLVLAARARGQWKARLLLFSLSTLFGKEDSITAVFSFHWARLEPRGSENQATPEPLREGLWSHVWVSNWSQIIVSTSILCLLFRAHQE